MALTKRTYSLPPETLMSFERAVPAGQRSSVITGLIRSWLEGGEREALRDEIILGCREMADEYRRLEEEFHPLEEEVERELSADSSSR
ncbi:MAG TPA: hypothetical protein VGG06_02345 [Thermoanaerobaculia bacterium]|jgi:transposase